MGAPAYRPDVPDDFPLSQVKILYNNEEINSFNLTYGYFLRKEVKNLTDPIVEADKRFARLCLTSVQKTGTNISEPSYKFNYYTGSESTDYKDIVPPFDCMAQDHWGYYNKSSIVNNDDANPTKEVLKDLMLNNSTYRQPSPGAAKFGLLKSVENPFGGKLTFEYEQNDSKDSDPPYLTKTTGGVRVFKTTVSDGISSANDIVTSYNYKMADGSTSGWGYENPNYLNGRQINIWNASSLQGYTYGGKMDFDLASPVFTAIASFILSKVPGLVGKIFTPSMPLPQAIIWNIIMQKMIESLIILFNPTSTVWSNSYIYFPYQFQNPIGVNYSRVEVINTSVPGGTGKSVSEFTAPANVRSEIPAFVMPYSPKQRFADWKYGLPSRTAIYNQSGSLLKEVINTYSLYANPVINNNYKSCKVEVIRPESASCDAASYNIPITDFSWEYYYPITGRSELISTTEKDYSPAGIMSQNDVTHTYNNDYLEKTTTTTKSNGDVIKVKNYYTNDYNNISTAIQEMKNRNMLAVPISTETWLTKPNGNEYLLDATVNEFTVLGDGEIKIKKIYKLETKQPLIKSLIGEQNPALLIRNSTYFKEQLNFNYDNNNGILQETTTPESRVSSKIVDYNYRIVTAEITNAAPNEVAYTSFEADQKGSWQYDLANIQSNGGVTGKKYFHFPANQISVTRTVSGTKTYILSLWNRGNGFTVLKDASPMTASKTVVNSATGWTYNEYAFTAPGNITINNSAALDLDELRLYPKDARMSTIAYDRRVGKISECDINNRLMYYEYDGLNRLQYVKDDRKNILKKICYNYAGEPENCLDMTDTGPQWRANGLTRCQPCPTNYNFNSGAKEYQEQDLNPQSPTYGTYRWTVDPTGSCPTPPFWVITNIYCQQNGYPPWGNTGYQITVQTDINPCSPTYNQTQQTSVYNAQACPPPIVCDPPCTAPQYKCINGQCVLGTWEVVRVVKLGKNGPWECTYAYCFPDGTTSTYTQTITSTTACVVTCF